MDIDPHILAPFARGEGRRTAVDVHDGLRRSILEGRFQPGAILSQVGLARALGVSRTPVREAMRMLQEEGLVSSEPNFRSRVIGFDPKDIEYLYMKRIVLESLGVSLTTQRMDTATLDELHEVIRALEGSKAHGSFPLWQDLHRRLHSLMVCKGGEPYVADLASLELHSGRYQSAYKGQHLEGWWQRGETEHRAIFEAMAARDAPLATQLAARHLARTALELLAALAPDHDTGRVRESLRFAVAAAQAQPATVGQAVDRRAAAPAPGKKRVA